MVMGEIRLVLRNTFFLIFHNTYNCDPFVFGPELAIDRIPRPVWCKFGLISSSKGFFHIDSPPRPVPVGSPP